MSDVIEDLKIHNESMFALEKEIKTFPVKSANVYKLKAEAIKKVADLSLRLEIITAQIMVEILKKAEDDGKPYPPSSRAEVRRMQVPLDKRYIRAKRDLNVAIFVKDNLEGLAKSFESKGYMLKELSDISDRVHMNEPAVYKKGGDQTYKGQNEIVEEGLSETENLLI